MKKWKHGREEGNKKMMEREKPESMISMYMYGLQDQT